MESTWKQHFFDFTGSSIASFIATAMDAAVYAGLVQLFVASESLSLELAAGIAAVVGGLIHYSLSRFWVFERFDTSIPKSVVTYFSMSWIAAAAHGLLTGWLAGLIGKWFAWITSKGLIWVFWTYPMSRYVVFGGFGANAD